MRSRWPAGDEDPNREPWSTRTVRLLVLVFSGVLTLTAMDAQGCWCRVFSGVPDSHSDRHSLSFLGSVGPLRTPGEASRLTAGVT